MTRNRLILVGLALLSMALIAYNLNANTVNAEEPDLATTGIPTIVIEVPEDAVPEAKVETEADTEEKTEEKAETKSPDNLEMFPIIGLGDVNAPVYLIEYASLSCGHCAEFHNQILPRIKEDFIDTGKVFIEFRDFPTSKPGLDATKLVRCMDPKRQYKFMDLLFQTQEQWAFTQDPTPLFQNAKLAGFNQESIDSCLGDQALENKLMESIQKARTTYSISSTPTVVSFPNNEKLKGLHNYKTVKKQIQRALKAAEE